MAHPNARDELRTIEELRERRSRNPGTIDRTYSLRLGVPEKARQEYGNDYDFRWINDVGQRIHLTTEIDTWQKVPAVDPVTVDADKDGKPIKAYLCMKPKEFIREDMTARDRAMVDVERAIVNGGSDQEELKEEGVSYVPKGSRNRIGRVTASTA